MSEKRENERIRNGVVGMYREFVSEVDPRNVLDHLIQKDIVSAECEEEMRSKVARQDRCRYLLDQLFSSPHEKSFIILREALEEHYPLIVERIDAYDARYENINSFNTTEAKTKSKTEQSTRKLDSTKTDSDLSKTFQQFGVRLTEAERKIDILEQELEQFRIQKMSQALDRKREFGSQLKLDRSAKDVFRSWRKYLTTKLKNNDPYDQPTASSSAYQELMLPIDSSIDEIDENNLYSECEKQFESFAIVIGRSRGDSIFNEVIKINLNLPDDVSMLDPIPTQIQMESAAAVYFNCIFVTGMGNGNDEIWKFDATSSNWKKCASMVRGRRRHSVAFVNHVLYICGGWVDSKRRILDDVEAYDTTDNKCVSVGKLAYAVHSSGNCVPFKVSLYIFGGIVANAKDVDSVQVYDTKFNTCTLLSKPMPTIGSHLRAVLLGISVILVGCKYSLIYKFDKEIWQVRDEFKTDVHYFGLAVNDDKIFVIGGGKRTTDAEGEEKWIPRDDVRCIPVENILNDEPIEWTHHAKLQKPLLVHAFGIISDFLA